MLNSIKRLINAHASPGIRQFALFFSEDKKVIKILRFLKFDGAARSYLEKSDRTLFIQKIICITGTNQTLRLAKSYQS